MKRILYYSLVLLTAGNGMLQAQNWIPLLEIISDPYEAAKLEKEYDSKFKRVK